jgi:hypothetical protein
MLLPEHGHGARGQCIAVDVQHELSDNPAEGVHSSQQHESDQKRPADLWQR